QLPSHLGSDVAAEGPSTDVVWPFRSHPTNRRDVRHGQIAHRAKRCCSGLYTCRLQGIDRQIGRKVLDKVQVTQDISANRVNQEQWWTTTRAAQRDKWIERPEHGAGRYQPGKIGRGRGSDERVERNLHTP